MLENNYIFFLILFYLYLFFIYFFVVVVDGCVVIAETESWGEVFTN